LRTADEIAKFRQGFAYAYNQGNVQALPSYYDENASLLLADQPMVQGKAAIAAQYSRLPERRSASIHLGSVDVVEEGSLIFDLACIFARSGDSSAANPPSAKYVVVLRRQLNGQLKMLVDATNITPASAASTDESVLRLGD
jgi:ketosteroid isomerase-like protein